MTSFLNQAFWDRLIRIVLGAGMFGIAWSGWVEGLGEAALQAFGWVPLLTGVVGWCPYYSILRVRTRRSGSLTE